MFELSHDLFLDLSTQRFVASPLSAGSAPPLRIPDAGDNVIAFNVFLLRRSGSGSLENASLSLANPQTGSPEFMGTQMQVVETNGTTVVAAGSDPIPFPWPDISLTLVRTGGVAGAIKVNELLKVQISGNPASGYFALVFFPSNIALTPVLLGTNYNVSTKRTPAFSVLNWTEDEIQEALDELWGTRVVAVSRIDRWSFNLEYVGPLAGYDVQSVVGLPQVSDADHSLLPYSGFTILAAFSSTLPSDPMVERQAYATLTTETNDGTTQIKHLLATTQVTLTPTPTLPAG